MRSSLIVPGDGRKPLAEFSALIRTSIAWPAPLDGVLGERERLTARDPDLLGDEVERRDHLGDAVLDLEPGVHLEEVELAVLGTRDRLVEHLDGAGVDVAARLRHLHRGLAHRRARRRR